MRHLYVPLAKNRFMFGVRLSEIPLPVAGRDREGLIDWIIETFNLVRRRKDTNSHQLAMSPIHRILRDYFLSHPEIGVDSNQLAEDFALTPAAIHHHMKRLMRAGLVTYSKGQGWRKYFLRGGSISTAISYFCMQARHVMKQRMREMKEFWTEPEHANEILFSGEIMPSVTIQLAEWQPQKEEYSKLSQFAEDIGLLGERPGKEILANSTSDYLLRELFAQRTISLDEVAEGIDRAKSQRVLERFRQTGVVERVPRIDRLSTAIWSAATTQFQRRGEEWLSKKGGFQRLEVSDEMLESIKQGELTPELTESFLESMTVERKMLLLNLLGGSLANGYRLCGSTNEMVERKMSDHLERILRRIQRVGDMLEKDNSNSTTQ